MSSPEFWNKTLFLTDFATGQCENGRYNKGTEQQIAGLNTTTTGNES
jgi:hypothetical protein